MIKDIYKNKYLKHPLTEEEIKQLPQVWKFLKYFKKRFIFITDYRDYIIDKINAKYTPEEFYKYESILNKMFWNLRWLMFPLWTNPYITESQYLDFLKSKYDGFERLPYSLLMCKYQKYNNSDELNQKLQHSYLYEDTYYRSFINKLIIVDQKDKVIITKSMEGSSDIFSKNWFNLLSFHILFDQDLYEQVMENPFTIRDETISLSQYYYQYDYGFPNLNVCAHSFGSKEDNIRRIKKMYYNTSSNKAKHWYRIIL
jgi:hypothetical protein